MRSQPGVLHNIGDCVGLHHLQPEQQQQTIKSVPDLRRLGICVAAELDGQDSVADPL